jgi:hypothetical protein
MADCTHVSLASCSRTAVLATPVDGHDKCRAGPAAVLEGDRGLCCSESGVLAGAP